MKNFTLGLITADFYPFTGGQGRNFYEMFEEIKHNSVFDIKVLSACKNNIRQHTQIFPKLYRSPLKSIAWSAALNLNINHLVKHHKLDIIFVNTGPGGVILNKKPSVPTIACANHTYQQQVNYLPNQNIKSILIPFEKRGYMLADKILSISKTTRDSLINDYEISDTKIEVYKVGMDLKRFRIMGNIKKESNTLFYLGRLDERKGIDFLISSLPEVKKHIPAFQLKIAGKGKLRKKLENMAETLKLSNNVKFLGFVPDNKVPELYNKSCVFIMPSIFEGLGITAIEAMACGTPVVATKVPGIVDLIKDKENGLLVRYGDTSALAKAIIKLLQDQKLYQQIRQNAFQRVQNERNWTVSGKFLVKRFEEYYKELSKKFTSL